MWNVLMTTYQAFTHNISSAIIALASSIPNQDNISYFHIHVSSDTYQENRQYNNIDNGELCEERMSKKTNKLESEVNAEFCKFMRLPQCAKLEILTDTHT